MARKKGLTTPSESDEKQLDSIVEDSKDSVTLRGHEYKIGWLRNGTMRKVTHILLSNKDDDKINSKCAAALLLNGYWKIKFFYSLLWRWFYYVKQYGDWELLPLVSLCKKKVPLETYYAVTILLTEMKDTMMVMKREEVERFRHESSLARHGQQVKNTDASPNP